MAESRSRRRDVVRVLGAIERGFRLGVVLLGNDVVDGFFHCHWLK